MRELVSRYDRGELRHRLCSDERVSGLRQPLADAGKQSQALPVRLLEIGANRDSQRRPVSGCILLPFAAKE